MRTRVEVEIVLYWNSWRVIFCSLVILCILSTLVTRSNPLGFVNITVIVMDHDSWSL